MIEQLTNLITQSNLNHSAAEFVSIILIFTAIILVSWLGNILCKKFIKISLHKLDSRFESPWFVSLRQNKSFYKLSHLVPGIIIYKTIPLIGSSIYSWTHNIISLIQSLALVYIVISIIWFVLSILNATLHWYKNISDIASKPILAYIQGVKIIIWAIGGILVISIIFNKSPLTLLAGLGAASAILLLVFKDTITGFVANIQVSAYDMVRVGDWVTLPAYGADGDIVEISVNTTKIQNFDKTIVTIPTSALITSGVKNWRGMVDSGGRRIKRSINIDIDTIKFCDQELLSRLHKLNFMHNYINETQDKISQHNKKLKIDTDLIANGRQLTNIGLFRAYISKYLENNSSISKDMTFLIRQLQPTTTGLPLELYIFTNDTNWVNYEGIQADIFDHIFAALPLFDLKAFQVFSSQSSQI